MEKEKLSIALECLRKIKNLTNAPDIDAQGEWRTGLFCGVEDRGCVDRYDGAEYGYTVGVERALEWAIGEAESALKEIDN